MLSSEFLAPTRSAFQHLVKVCEPAATPAVHCSSEQLHRIKTGLMAAPACHLHPIAIASNISEGADSTIAHESEHRVNILRGTRDLLRIAARGPARGTVIVCSSFGIQGCLRPTPKEPTTLQSRPQNGLPVGLPRRGRREEGGAWETFVRGGSGRVDSPIIHVEAVLSSSNCGAACACLKAKEKFRRERR